MYPYVITGVLAFLFILLSLEPFLVDHSDANAPDRSLATEKIQIPPANYDVPRRVQSKQNSSEQQD